MLSLLIVVWADANNADSWHTDRADSGPAEQNVHAAGGRHLAPVRGAGARRLEQLPLPEAARGDSVARRAAVLGRLRRRSDLVGVFGACVQVSSR